MEGFVIRGQFYGEESWEPEFYKTWDHAVYALKNYVHEYEDDGYEMEWEKNELDHILVTGFGEDGDDGFIELSKIEWVD